MATRITVTDCRWLVVALALLVLPPPSRAADAALAVIAARLQTAEATLTKAEAELAALQQQSDGYVAAMQATIAEAAPMALALGRLAQIPGAALMLRPGAPAEAWRSFVLLDAAIDPLRTRGVLLNQASRGLTAARAGLLGRQQDARDAVDRLRDQRQALIDAIATRPPPTPTPPPAAAATLPELMVAIVPPPRESPVLPPGPGPAAPGPVAGSITTGFGVAAADGTLAQGLTIAARAGAVVTAPFSGVVRFVGPFRGYRQILIVDHGGGYHSLFAGLDRVLPSQGDRLQAGDPVGLLPLAGNPLADAYFELRHDGQPVDPAPFLVLPAATTASSDRQG